MVQIPCVQLAFLPQSVKPSGHEHNTNFETFSSFNSSEII